MTALVPLLVACGNGADEVVSPGPAADEQAPADTQGDEQEVAEAPALALTPEQVEMVLLPAEDLGGLFTEVTGDTSSGNEASPEDLGCLAGVDDLSGAPVASAARDYEGVLTFVSMQVDSYESEDNVAASFDAAKEALATCGTETIDGTEVDVYYDPEFTDGLVQGVDDQIFADLYGVVAEEGIEVDIFVGLAMIRIENNAAMLFFAEFGSSPSSHEALDREGAVQQVADRLRAVMDGEDLTATAPPPSGPGTYEFEYQGAIGTIEVPTDPSHPDLAEFEDYRQAVDAEPVTYFVTEVDNTDGADSINMYQIVVITEDGQQIHAEGVEWMIGEWRDLVDTEANEQIDLRNRGIDLSNDQLGSLLPGAKDTMVLATSEPVDSVSRVYVYPSGGFDRVEATKSDDAGS